MAKIQSQVSNLRDLYGLLEAEKDLLAQQEQRKEKGEQEQFEKDKEYLLEQLADATQANDKKAKLTSLAALGKLYRGNGDLDKAITYYERILETDKKHPRTLEELGIIYRDVGEYDRAIEYFQRGSDPVKVIGNISRTYRAKADYEGGISYAEGELNKVPESKAAMIELGINYRLKQDYDKSIKWLERVLEIDPRDDRATDELANTYQEMGDYRKANIWLRRCIISKIEQTLAMDVDMPDRKEARNRLGTLRREVGDYDKAIELFKNELKMHPNDGSAMDGLGITYREIGVYDEAIAWFERKLALYPNNRTALNGLGITFLAMGNFEKAIMWFDRFLGVDSSSRQAMNGLGTTYLTEGDYDQAIKWFEKVLGLYQDDTYSLRNLVKAYAKTDRISEAVEYLKYWLISSPDSSMARGWLRLTAEDYESAGKFTEAKEILDFLHEIQIQSIPPVSRKEGDVESDTALLEEKIGQLQQAIGHQTAEILRSRQMMTLGVMASGLAHEINQPLQVILSVAQNCAREILRDVIDSEGILIDLDKVTANTERISKIVNHLLVLARDHKPKREEVDVNTVIENSFIMFYQQLTKSRGIKIIKDLSEKLPSIKADSIQLEQVFINLINNARDALDGCKDRIIEVSSKKQDEHILVEFRDSGKGIAPEDLPKIFDAFFTTKEEGMGLGLHIARDIVQSYGGTIIARSELNEGTTFLMELSVAEEVAE